jgi:subtilisin family serine protease
VHGWNFDANNNDPTPGEQNSHGTHVAGIIGAVKSNALGVAGIAPKVKVMPIKFYGENRWTSAIVFNSYKYAMDNGAKIINTSYNIDGFINDKIYLEALAYVKEKNGLVFNSAGNNGQKDPPRRSLSDIVLVCSTQANRLKPQLDDVISKFSNYGQGIDLCAPGDPILSTVNGQYQGQYRYGELSGTSMASPVAAAVAALIWSRNPSLTNQEVLNKLLESTDNIDEKNPRFRGLMGSGRINALKAVEAN